MITAELGIGYTNANEMVGFLESAASNGSAFKTTTSGAQFMANRGALVIAGWANPTGGSGHVALVIGDTNKYSADSGPRIMQSGVDTGEMHMSDGFGGVWGLSSFLCKLPQTEIRSSNFIAR